MMTSIAVMLGILGFLAIFLVAIIVCGVVVALQYEPLSRQDFLDFVAAFRWLGRSCVPAGVRLAFWEARARVVRGSVR